MRNHNTLNTITFSKTKCTKKRRQNTPISITTRIKGTSSSNRLQTSSSVFKHADNDLALSQTLIKVEDIFEVSNIAFTQTQ